MLSVGSFFGRGFDSHRLHHTKYFSLIYKFRLHRACPARESSFTTVLRLAQGERSVTSVPKTLMWSGHSAHGVSHLPYLTSLFRLLLEPHSHRLGR
jgi:hypothetical protein